jgi:DNA polymerase-3 subunit epsilon
MKLKSMPVFFLDLQTTGAKPDNSYILEMAYGPLHDETQSFLVEQPPEYEIPRRIQIITGVKASDMKDATPFPEAMKRLLNFIKTISKLDNIVCVIHFAQFEKPFLTAAFESIHADMPFTILCTHDIAKRLLPNLPTRGIKGLSGYFGYDAGELKRSASHVDATKVIWAKLLETLEEKEVTTYEELQNWFIETPKAKKTKYEYPLPKEKRLDLPKVPGIYRMLNYQGEVLYVGKATSLRDRVNSYFRGQKNRDPKKLEMLTQVYDLRVTPCATPLEAALMETDEIKKLNPRYNISLKATRRSLAFFDKEFVSVSSTPDEFHTIGPFSNAMVFESIMKLSLYLNTIYKDGGLPDGDLFFEELDPQLLKDGFEVFCLRHNFAPETFTSVRSMIAMGIIWQRRYDKELSESEEAELELQEADLDDSTEIEEETEELNDLITVDDLADKFERHFMRIARAYMRVRKINRMLNADIEFSIVNKAKRVLQVRNGIVHYTPEDHYENSENSWKDHSVETYDRMTVLLTELERIRSQNGNYHISFID